MQSMFKKAAKSILCIWEQNTATIRKQANEYIQRVQ